VINSLRTNHTYLQTVNILSPVWPEKKINAHDIIAIGRSYKYPYYVYSYAHRDTHTCVLVRL